VKISSISPSPPFTVTSYGNSFFGLVSGDLNDPTHNSFGLTGGLTGVDTDTASWLTTLAGTLNPCPSDCNYPNGKCICGTCQCSPSYYGEFCEGRNTTACTQTCGNGVLNGDEQCDKGFGCDNSTCTCSTGFEVTDPRSKDCRVQTTFIPTKYPPLVDPHALNCVPDCFYYNQCGETIGAGTCVGPNYCVCKTGYLPPGCLPDCSSVAPLGCLNGGTCASPNNCSCPSGTSGSDCSITACGPNSCYHGGRCAIAANGTCDCSATSYGGPSCQTLLCNPPCSHGGVCLGPSQGCDCASTGGYYGLGCQYFTCSPQCTLPAQCISPNVCYAATTGTTGTTQLPTTGSTGIPLTTGVQSTTGAAQSTTGSPTTGQVPTQPATTGVGISSNQGGDGVSSEGDASSLIAQISFIAFLILAPLLN